MIFALKWEGNIFPPIILREGFCWFYTKSLDPGFTGHNKAGGGEHILHRDWLDDGSLRVLLPRSSGVSAHVL